MQKWEREVGLFKGNAEYLPFKITRLIAFLRWWNKLL